MRLLAHGYLLPPRPAAAEGVAIPSPGRVYYETLGAGLVLALFIILLTVPLLRRMSAPGNVRFE